MGDRHLPDRRYRDYAEKVMTVFLALIAVSQAFMALILATGAYMRVHHVDLMGDYYGTLQWDDSDLRWINLMDTVETGRQDIEMFASKKRHPAGWEKKDN